MTPSDICIQYVGVTQYLLSILCAVYPFSLSNLSKEGCQGYLAIFDGFKSTFKKIKVSVFTCLEDLKKVKNVQLVVPNDFFETCGSTDQWE